MSRARTIIQNSFGLAARIFEVFRCLIIAKVDKVIALRKDFIALHKFLMSLNESNDGYCHCPQKFFYQDKPGGPSPGERRQDQDDMRSFCLIARIAIILEMQKRYKMSSKSILIIKVK